MKKPLHIYTADLETDPFLKDRKPEPFCAGLYDGAEFRCFWSSRCCDDLCDALYNKAPGIVYIHNGGKFDLFYMLHRIDMDKPMLIIHERITECFVKCAGGYHKVRDSLKILPFALAQYQKDEIDYTKLEADVRELHKDEIISYLKGDCVYLHELCSEYINTFGPAITIGSTAMKELKKFHEIGEPLTQDIDAQIRNPYFIGGRVERMRTGVHAGNWKVYDVNSMYPYVMSAFNHPIGRPSYKGHEITERTYFITARGRNHGAFAVRDKHAGIKFDVVDGIFSTTIHEWNTALELGLFEPEEIIETVDFAESRCFFDYITHFYKSRKKATIEGDKIKSIFYKFLLNNSYGKFAVNPENFKEYRLTDSKTDLRWHGFTDCTIIEGFDLIMWSKPCEEFKYANVATGASITGAARSILMRGLHHAVNPVYCDTDCVICEDLQGVTIDDAVLGAWKLEKSGNKIAIAGRKMYALFDDSKCVKYASKGVRIDPLDIVRAAQGETVVYERDAPTYRLNGSVDWITRKVRMV